MSMWSYCVHVPCFCSVLWMSFYLCSYNLCQWFPWSQLEFYPHGKSGVGFGLYFFPQYAQLVCSGKSSLRELNGSIPQTKLCGETTWWYLFHSSTASERRVVSEMLDNWIPKCRQRMLECFFSHCIGCRIKANVRRPLGQSCGALLLLDIYFTIWPSPQLQHFVRKTLFSFKSSEKFCLNLKRQILCRFFFPCFLKTFFLLLHKSRSH